VVVGCGCGCGCGGCGVWVCSRCEHAVGLCVVLVVGLSFSHSTRGAILAQNLGRLMLDYYDCLQAANAKNVTTYLPDARMHSLQLV
jgi:hypothetical protein